VDSFGFLPQGCTPSVDCTGVHAVVLGIGAGPFADGVTLYTCRVAIAGDAPLGIYPVHATAPLASGPQGESLPVRASDGRTEVAAPPAPVCVGACDDDLQVAINELLTGVNIVIGSQPLTACTTLDSNGDGTAAINEIVQAVNNALNGCPT